MAEKRTGEGSDMIWTLILTLAVFAVIGMARLIRNSL